MNEAMKARMLRELDAIAARAAGLQCTLAGLAPANGGLAWQTKIDLGCVAAAARRGARRLRGESRGAGPHED